MPMELVKIYAAEIVMALHAMHSKNIIHRDLKPENILIADNWHLKLVSCLLDNLQIDFGDAFKLEDEQNVGQQDEEEKKVMQKRKATFVGTPLYVSPEMLSDSLSCAAGDLWALGCIIFQMLTGKVPFNAQHDFQTFQLILERKMVFPPDMEAEAKDLIDRLLDINHMTRFGAGRKGSGNDLTAVMAHPFFNDVNFQTIYQTIVPIPA